MPFVSVIIPCRNEGAYIRECLGSVLRSDYPKNRMEVLVVDGMSSDATRETIREFVREHKMIKLLDNPRKTVPSALNLAIRSAKGDVIFRMDAHSRYGENYISKCVTYLEQYGADNVGGLIETLPGSNTAVAKSIALALSHPFGVGNAYFRVGSQEVKYVDTVPFGCFKKSIFERFGYFDEDLVRNQDDEMNSRIIKNGGKILLAPDIVIPYYARDTIGKLWRMYFQYGYFKVLAAKKLGSVYSWRQLIPSIFAFSLFLSAVLSFAFRSWIPFLALIVPYSLLNLGTSVIIAGKKGWKHFFTLPVIFPAIHTGYGLGYLKGILDFIFLKKNKRKKVCDLPLTR